MTKPERLNNLDFIRFILAFGVVIHHIVGVQNIPLMPGIPFNWVGGFIAISGYLVTKSMEGSRGYGHFAWKRLLRVGPAFAVALALSVALGATLMVELTWWATMGLVQRPGLYNAPLWSLSVEEVLYALLAASFASGMLRWKYRAWVVGAFLISAYWFDKIPVLPGLLGNYSLTMPYYFAAGVFLYCLKDTIKFSVPAALLCLALEVSRYSTLGAMPSSITLPFYASPLLLAYGLITLGLYAPPVIAWWSRIGDASFGIYVYHYPIMIWLAYQGVKDWRLLWVLPLVVLPLSFASWHLLEKPSLKLKDKKPRFPFGKSQQLTPEIVPMPAGALSNDR
jgi:peptidoglycan/LPS O-acetylase OafA/YrhL